MRRLVVIGAVVLALAAWAAEGGNNPNPDAIREVESGTRTVANAAWWGFNEEDVTESLQGAINSGAATVIVPYMGSPWIVRPITLRGNLELRFEPGVIVEAKRGEFTGKGDSLFKGANIEDVTLRGYGAALRMHKEDYRKEPYAKAEWRMVLALLSCTNVRVEGLALESSGGDGIYVGVGGDEQSYCKDMVIRDVTCSDHYRQGISVISAENLLIENCVMQGTEGTAPAAGIDFEPNNANERLANCVVRNCTFAANQGPGILLYLNNLKSSSVPVSVAFEACLVDGGQGHGISVGTVGDDGPAGNISFRGCTVRKTGWAALEVYDKSATAASLAFTDCAFDSRGNPQHSPLRLLLRRPQVTQRPGGIVFERCVVFDDQDRPFLTYGSKDESIGLRDVRGSVQVLNPHGARVDVGPVTSDLALEVE